jgi:hypothetical protein
MRYRCHMGFRRQSETDRGQVEVAPGQNPEAFAVGRAEAPEADRADPDPAAAAAPLWLVFALPMPRVTTGTRSALFFAVFDW